MLPKKPLYSAYTLFLYIFLIHLPCSTTATYNHSCPQPSSCGSLTNISYPFRLKDDPPNCGDRYFELICENSQTPILILFSRKYLVKAINYTDSTIQLVDFGVHTGDCTSVPLHSISLANFTNSYPYYPYLYDSYYLYYRSSDRNYLTLLFITCETPQKSHLYLNSSSCLTTKNKYSYVLLDDTASSIGDSCAIDLMIMAVLGPANTTNITYTELHNFLANGFILSWYSWFCADCKGQGNCIYNSTTCVVTCSSPCSFKHVSSPRCFFKLVGDLLLGAGLSIVNVLFYYIVLYPVIQVFITPIVIFVFIRFICGWVCVLVLLIYKWRRRHLSMYDSIEEFLKNNNNLMPIRYSYDQIKRITNNFDYKLGEGGYGSVYRGKLRSGYLVAVKILGKSKASGQDFMNEVATIGRIHHVNVVRLTGFCVEGSKRALIYDFMPNGSLDKYVFRREGYTNLSWEKMYEISLGVARGIEYLHRGCEMQILHFDIKPHNILLDENFVPKVSDFGLAKLYSATSNTVSLTAARGTIGYIAPELFYKNIGSVSYKADVYSFGMLLMEMAGKRQNLNPVAEHSSQMYFPFWVHDQIVNDKEVAMEGTEDERRTAKKMVIVALWCIQMNPNNRPSMNKVLEMLEGNPDGMEMPPRPSFFPEEKLENDDADDINQTGSYSATIEFSESSGLVSNMA